MAFYRTNQIMMNVVSQRNLKVEVFRCYQNASGADFHLFSTLSLLLFDLSIVVVVFSFQLIAGFWI